MKQLNIGAIHPSWKSIIPAALAQLDRTYLIALEQDAAWLPGHDTIFNAFSLPISQVNYVLFGESPYPRAASANGFAFWDQAVTELWSTTGLSIPVNRATSLRNFIKMLLIAEGYLSAKDVSQEAIAELDKTKLVSTASEFFNRMLAKGFLLWNASLVLSSRKVSNDAKHWRPFIESVLTQLQREKPEIELILWGKIAEQINTLPVAHLFKQHVSEHPYNVTFIHNQTMQNFFRPLHLLNT